MSGDFNAEGYLARLEKCDPLKLEGVVKKVIGLVIESQGPPASIGELCDIIPHVGGAPIPAQVVGFRDRAVLSMPFYKMNGVRVGDSIVARRRLPAIKVGDELLGRTIDALGAPLDDKGPLGAKDEYPLYGALTNPLRRRSVAEILETGIRTIDGLLTCGKGQRIGIFGGSGVGKSTLLGMLTRYSSVDVKVIALVGERGREVRSFIEKDLRDEGLSRSVLVVATSDSPPLMRLRAGLTATAIAEYFCRRKHDVLLIMDSLTRFAMAQREVGLAAGEPPSAKGYTPSVFSLLPQLVERAGCFVDAGSISAFYTVLVEGDDMADPIADAARSLLDGHIVLSRELSWRNHYPSIDVLQSNSRLMADIVPQPQQNLAGKLKELLAAYQKAEDLINIGAYAKGSNQKIDLAISKIEAINAFLCQRSDESSPYARTLEQLRELLS